MQRLAKRSQVCPARACHLQSFLPPYTEANTAIFCGTPEQRVYAGLYALSGFCGKYGIVCLHQSASFNDQLRRDVYRFRPELQQRGDFFAYVANTETAHYYSPLSGMTAAHILEAILPFSQGSNADTHFLQMRYHLQNLLTILEAMRVPWSLDALMWLAEMPNERFENDILQRVEHLHIRLADSQTHHDTCTLIQAFAAQMSFALWTRSENPSQLSIIRAIKDKSLISIYVNHEESLYMYLAQELRQLMEQGVPFVVMASEVSLAGTPLQNLLFSLQGNCHVVITAAHLGQIFEPSNDQMSRLRAKCNAVIVHNCPDAQTAEPFSAACGEYMRHALLTHYSKHRRAFQLFSDHEVGVGEQETMTRCVRPEELMQLGAEGALLLGQNCALPILTPKLLIP